MSAENPLDEIGPLLKLLRPAAPVADRLRGFAQLGLSLAQVRQAISVSPESLRLWAKGGPVRPANRRVVDNIGQAATILLEGLRDRATVVEWLMSPTETDVPPPLELIRDQAEAVLAAAEARVAGRVKQERDFLGQAAEGRKRSVAAPGAMIGTTERSSTQVNRLLLARLHEIVANHSSAQDVMRQLDAGYEPELERLPNYQAYRSFLERVRKVLEDAGDAPAQQAISSLLTKTSADEQALWDRFEEIGKQLVRDDTTILTYALSMRVIQVLWGVSEATQRSCRLFVAEGRVKSVPQSGELPPFADAAEIIRFLDSNGYERSIVPDAVAPTLLEAGRVQLVLLGAQKVFIDSDGCPTHFVGTAGTNAILRAARVGGAEVAVLAEEGKAVEEDPKVDPRERVVSVRLPATGGSSAGEHAPLLTLSAELCNVDPNDEAAVANPSIVRLVNTAGVVPSR